MGNKRITRLGILVFLLVTASCHKKIRIPIAESPNSIKEKYKADNYDGVLFPGENRVHDFLNVSSDDIIRIDITDGWDLLKKYRNQPKVAVWVEDADSDRKIVGTLLNAYDKVGSPSNFFRVRVKNETHDKINYSLKMIRASHD